MEPGLRTCTRLLAPPAAFLPTRLNPSQAGWQADHTALGSSLSQDQGTPPNQATQSAPGRKLSPGPEGTVDGLGVGTPSLHTLLSVCSHEGMCMPSQA